MRRRKPTKLGIIGAILGCLGVVGLTWGNVQEFHPDRIGIALVIVAAVLICYKRLELACTRLEQKNMAADEIYNIGRERGHEDGYEEGYHDRGLEQPIKPVVVPMPQQSCPDCGHSLALQPVGSVADRG